MAPRLSNTKLADEIFDLQNILILAMEVVGKPECVGGLEFALEALDSKLADMANFYDGDQESEAA